MNCPTEYEIYGRHTSYNVQKVLWLADELGVEYAHTEIGGRFGGTNSAEFLSMNPSGKVPVLRHQQREIWESNSIIRYLADMHENEGWISSDPYRRSQTDRWLDWSIDRLEKAFIGVFWGYYRTPPNKRNLVTIKQSTEECESCLALLSHQLAKQNYLLGDKPTVADVANGVYLHRLKAIDLTIKVPDNIEHWYQRLSKQLGYRRWVMSDFSELKGRVDY